MSIHCHQTSQAVRTPPGNNIALIGHPNVGKSVLFQRLTGQQVIISNYPGTTVEVLRGSARDLPETILVDTPGVVAFPPHSEEEQVTARVLFSEPLKAIVQVGDAKNLRRTLLLTVQLAEMGLPLVLDLNMMDEANSRGVKIDYPRLAQALALPVVQTTAVRGLGLQNLTEILKATPLSDFSLEYPAAIETAVESICQQLPPAPIAPRAIALLWLSGDQVVRDWLGENLSTSQMQALERMRAELEAGLAHPAAAIIQETRLAFVEDVVGEVLLASGNAWRGFGSWLGQISTQPLAGTLILLLVLYGIYWFVGVFGAGTLVDLMESRLFGELINPWVTRQVEALIPLRWLSELFVGEYGLWTVGMTYALALIFPIVTTFFLAFGVMEDSGYLPRLAALSNRLFQALGLNGKAVLPMVLGLGCVTMATLTTRVLDNRRERLLVTLLLALAIPCSAQLGVVMGLLAGISLTATLIWGGIVFLVLLAVGWLAARLVPGERSQLLVELPPLRVPVLSNVILKTVARLEWYLKEVIPLFLIGTLVMYLLDRSGLLAGLIRAGEPLVAGWLGLPPQASAAFLMGFLRRDFGATGLFLMESQGLLSPLQVVVAMVTVTLFIPCIASVLVISKERGWRTAAGILAIVFPLAFLVGGLLNRLLMAIGWGL